MQAEVTAAQAELHGDSEADEGRVAWPDSETGGREAEEGEEDGEEGSQAVGSSHGKDEETESEGAAGAGSPAAQPQRQLQQQRSQPEPQRRLSGADLKQVDIRSFFSGRRGSDGG